MTADYPTDEVPATPEYVLDVLRDWHAQLAAVDQADRNFTVSAEATVDDFADGFVELNWESCGWRTVADALNDTWELTIMKDEWQPILNPGHVRTLGDVARFLAERVPRPVVRPWKCIAGECLPAGYFLTVRALLGASGADPHAITPTTLLGPYVTAYRESLFQGLTRLAPRRLPPMQFQPYHWSGRGMTGIGFLLLLIAIFLMALSTSAGCWLFVFGGTLFVAGSILDRTKQVELPGLVTFRDLAYALAGQEPRRRIKPTP